MATTVSTPERRVANLEETGRSAHSTSSSRTRMTSSPSRPSNTQITIESVLQNANGDTMSALELVLNERNLLSTQNTQLWKLVEKQRVVHSNVSKELERVRAERDKALAKLDSGRDDRKAKASTLPSSSTPISRSETSSPVAERPNGRRTPTSQYHPDTGHHRHPSKPSGSLSASRSHEPIRSHTDEHTYLSPGDVEADTDKLASANHTSPTTHTLSPNRAVPEPRPGAIPEASASGERSLYTQNQSDSSPFNPQTIGTSNSFSSTSPNPTETPSSSKLSVPPFRDRKLSRESRIILPDEARRYIASLQDSPITSFNSHQFNNLTSTTITEEPSSMDDDISKASAVSKSHADDSATSVSSGPIARPSSPRILQVEHGSDRRTPPEGRRSTEGRKANVHPSKTVPERQGALTPPPASSNVPLATPRPERQRTTQPRQSSRPEPTVATSGEVTASPHTINSVSTHIMSSTPQSAPGQDMNSNTPKANSFPNTPSSSARAQILAQRAQAQSQAQVQLQPQSQFQTQTPQYQDQIQIQGQGPLRISPQRNGPTHDMERSNEAIPEQRAPEYSAQNANILRSTKRMYLVEADLPRCKVSVVGSHIRPNDRGKEVLSFSIEVSPSETESSWKVEKLYSDVLALDSKIRSKMSRSNAKKLANLPESKLFKDNAPAKVDQRKAALETYLQSVLRAAVKEPDDICDFFSTDLINKANAPVTQMGYKEGYLTKRGKNFGGWKTRYFVLNGPKLDYYESRGGAHLGHILITGAQIGRQSRPGSPQPAHTDDESEYRHAILILEPKKGTSPVSFTRHVLCAESDQERDNWIEVLIRYVSGTYDETGSPSAGVLSANIFVTSQPSQPRPSTSSITSYDSTAATPSKRHPRSNNTAPTTLQDQSKHLQAAPIPGSASSSPLEYYPSQQLPDHANSPDDVPISSSLPTHLNTAGGGILSQRAASELGHYAELGGIRQHYQEPQKSSHRQDRQQARMSMHPLRTYDVGSSLTADTSPSETPRVKISGPINGTPIPSGHKFGSKEAQSGTESGNERERKSKSRNFWTGIIRSGHNDNNHNINNTPAPPRVVFGILVADALQVAQIANLPAVAFRCIQYLEAKGAAKEEGIYRLSGSSAVVKGLRDKFNAEGDYDLLKSGESWDPHAIAGLLKSYFREIPDGVLTRELQAKFTAVIDLADVEERLDELTQLVSQLPVANYSLLRALVAHLILIVQNSAVNKMTMRNVGIVFSPTLVIPAGVFSLMLNDFNRVFNVDGDTADADVEEAEAEADTAVPSDNDAHLRTLKRTSLQNNRNSRSYADGAADHLLGLGGRTLPQEEESDSADDITIPDSVSEMGSESQDPDATTQFYQSNLEITQPDPVVTETETEGPADKTPVNRTRKQDKASATAASRGLQVTVGRGNTNFVGLPASPHPSTRGL